MRALGKQHLQLTALLLVLWLGSVYGASDLQARILGTQLHGITYYSLRDVTGRLGMQYATSLKKRKVQLKSQWSDLEFKADCKHFSLNDLKLFLGNPIALHRGTFYISQRDYEKTLSPILTPQVFPNPPRLHRIVIDPGHGGKDPGAQNIELRLHEKNLALDVAQSLRQKLRGYGYDVYLTRDKDVFIGLKERAQFTNRLKADLFISIHFNAIASGNVQGMECYTFTPPYQPSSHRDKLHAKDKRFYPANRNDPWNQLVGYAIQRTLINDIGGVDRGLKRARWTVLGGLQCPGVLVELGFLTHKDEAKLIRQAGYREKLVASLARGIQVYKNTLHRINARQRG